ncbi:MAG: apolipoprotein N-acyltransferase, partial [Bacteroidota bacterium]|nr:apolipoprotein N-acyltransferase [Bacteroidota bacterium]
MNIRSYKLFLAALSGVLLGAAFPPIPTGITAAFAFIPFFLLFESIDDYAKAFRYSYTTFFVFNLTAMYWVGGFTHCKDVYMIIAGLLLLLAHPIFFYVPIVIWMFIKRSLGFKFSIITFPFLWVGFEYIHSLTEIGFPWLTLGNTQTYDVAIIQIASVTGVYGISFWLLWLNVIGFVLFTKLAIKAWNIFSWNSFRYILLFLLIYFLPKFYGNHVLESPSLHSAKTIKVAAIQPNIDPFEKWTVNPEEPLDNIQRQTNEIVNKQVDLVLWPETAMPFYILHPNNRYHFEKIKFQVDTMNINLLTGIPDIHYFKNGEMIPKSSKISIDGQWYETYNSSMLLQPGSDVIQKYAKIVLVPFAERVPFSEALSFLNAAQWNFGLGGWARGKDTTVFQFSALNGEPVKFSNMICYESVIPSLVSAFVKEGAQFLTIITNDSWWGNTSGAYQHKQFAVLRAIENRRWVVQCANGGISCFIDPYGRMMHETKLFTQTIVHGEVELRDEKTFYTENGDWFAE